MSCHCHVVSCHNVTCCTVIQLCIQPCWCYIAFGIVVLLSQAGVIGQTFCEMMHPADRRDLEACGGHCKQGDTRGMFVTRLRTSMAPALRSEARMEYKVLRGVLWGRDVWRCGVLWGRDVWRCGVL